MEEPVDPGLLAAWLADPSSAVVVTDRRGRVLCWDDSAARLVGWNTEETGGQRLDRLLGVESAPLRSLLAGAAAGSTAVVPLRARTRAGEPVELRAFARMIVRGRGVALAVVLGSTTDHDEDGSRAMPGLADPVELALTERVARAEAEQAMRSLSRLQAVAAALGQPLLSLAHGVDRVVKEMTAAAGADAVSVYGWDAGRQQLALLANQGSSPEMCTRFASVSLDVEIPVTDAFRDNEAVWVRSLRERRTRFSALDLAGPDSHHSIAALPLVASGQPLGALALAYRQERTFPPEERTYLQTLGDLCAYVLARGQLYDAERVARAQAERDARKMQALQKILDAAVDTDDPERLLGEMLECLREVLGADRAALYSVAGKPAHLVLRAVRETPGPVPTPERVPLSGDSPVLTVDGVRPLRTEEAMGVAVLGPGTKGWAGSIVAAPLVAAGRLSGAVVVGAARSHHFDDDATELLVIAVRRMAVALGRAATFLEEGEAHRRLELLLDAARLVSSSAAGWEAVDRLVRVAVPAVAHTCLVALPRGSALHRVAVAHAEPAIDAMCRLLVGQCPFPLEGQSPLAEAFRSGTQVTAEALTPTVLKSWVDDPEYASFAEALGVESFLAVPLRSRGAVIGAAGFGWTSSRREPFDDRRPPLAAELAGFIEIAVQRAFDAVRDRDLEAAFGPVGRGRWTLRDGPEAAIQLLLVDEFPVVRHGVRLLADRAPDIEICGEAASLAEAEEGEWDPDVVVHELVLPDCNGPEVVSRLAARFPRARLLALTRMDQPTYVHLALTSGAAGYLLKESASGELVDVIRRIAAGQDYVEPSLGSALAHWQAIPKRHSANAGTALTRREQEVLELVALGHTNAEIAETLAVSLRTVETHRSHLAQKLGVRSRAALVTRARELGGATIDLREPTADDSLPERSLQ